MLTLDIWRMLARGPTHLGNLVVDTDSVVIEQRGIRALQHIVCSSNEAIGLVNTVR